MTTSTPDLEGIRYPIGRFEHDPDPSPELLARSIAEIAEAPARLRRAVAGLDDDQLDTRYRDEGWSLRQVVHHVADSHINGYVRCKKAAAEPGSPAAVYDQPLWAELPDSREPVEVSLDILDALHRRWTALFRALDGDDWNGSVEHPEWGTVPLSALVQLYAWHGRHHTGHILGLRERMGW